MTLNVEECLHREVCFGIFPDELEEVAEKREVRAPPLRLLPLRPKPRISGRNGFLSLLVIKSNFICIPLFIHYASQSAIQRYNKYLKINEYKTIKY